MNQGKQNKTGVVELAHTAVLGTAEQLPPWEFVQVRTLSPAHLGLTNFSYDIRKKRKTGPEPERVKTDKPWEKTVSDALKKERPKEGWPKDKE